MLFLHNSRYLPLTGLLTLLQWTIQPASIVKFFKYFRNISRNISWNISRQENREILHHYRTASCNILPEIIVLKKAVVLSSFDSNVDRSCDVRELQQVADADGLVGGWWVILGDDELNLSKYLQQKPQRAPATHLLGLAVRCSSPSYKFVDGSPHSAVSYVCMGWSDAWVTAWARKRLVNV